MVFCILAILFARRSNYVERQSRELTSSAWISVVHVIGKKNRTWAIISKYKFKKIIFLNFFVSIYLRFVDSFVCSFRTETCQWRESMSRARISADYVVEKIGLEDRIKFHPESNMGFHSNDLRRLILARGHRSNIYEIPLSFATLGCNFEI